MEEHGRRRKRLSARLSRRCRAAYLGRRAVRLAAVTQGHRARNRVSWAVRAASAHAADPIKIGHVAALSGASAQSGEAITRGLSLAIDEINAKGGLLGGRMLEVVQRDDEFEPAQGFDRRARACLRRRGGSLRRHRHAGVAGRGAAAQQGEAHLHGRVGRRHRHHAQRRHSQLRLPRFGGGCPGRRAAARLCAQEVRREESRPDAHQQSLGTGQREGPCRRQQGRSIGRDRRHREIREQ